MSDKSVAEANQVLFFNATESYRVSHPVAGGDASLTVILDESHLHELAPTALLRGGQKLAFRKQSQRIEASAQVLIAQLRHSLRHGIGETLEAESLVLTLARTTLGPRTASKSGATYVDGR
jgi:AraC family transcriptional regulator